MAYVYRHIRLDKNEPFYIGIGSDDNYKRANCKLGRNNMWNKIVNKTKYRVDIVLDNLSWEEACEKEIELISLYGRINKFNGFLSNLTDGGEGTLGILFTEDRRVNLSIVAKKRYENPNQRLKISLGQKKSYKDGRMHPWIGRKHSEESNKKNSESQKNLYENGYISPLKGKPKTNEHKEKLSNSHKGKKLSEIHKKNIGIHSKGGKNNSAKLVINLETGFFYDCGKDAFESQNQVKAYSTFKCMLNGSRLNKTPFQYA